MLTFFAHAGEHHETAAEATTHAFLQDWYIALPLLVLSVVGLATIAFFIFKRSKSAAYLTVCGSLLVIGTLTYTLSPIVSIVSLTVGMGMTLFTVLASLMPRKKA